LDAAERFIGAVIEAEGDDLYRENDEGSLLLCTSTALASMF
jgi:hypothetical protein